MSRILLELAYKGTNYHGWQIQSKDLSVQSVLEQTISKLIQNDCNVVGCGRTDTGVHAKQYFAHLDITDDPKKITALKAMNALLPVDIYISKMYEVSSDFHARFDASSRKYIYKIHFYKDPFQAGDSLWFRDRGELSITKLSECAKIILALTEFNSFVKANSGLEEFGCTIFESRWEQMPSGHMEYHIKANRFVRGMVRLIVGMCINYALDKISLEQIQQDLLMNRQITKSWSMPAEGLSLVEIIYPKEKMDLWRSLELRI